MGRMITRGVSGVAGQRMAARRRLLVEGLEARMLMDAVLPQGMPPANDLLANAERIDAADLVSGYTDRWSVSGTNVDATAEPGEEYWGCGRSIWYRWQATATTSVRMDTFGSNFDTLLFVFAGPLGIPVSELQMLAANDNASGSLQSALSLPVTAGATYWIAVDGTNAATGAVQLNLAMNRPPTGMSLAGSLAAEDQPAGTPVGRFSTADPDAGDTFTYSLVSGAGSQDNAKFVLSGNQLQTAAVFDYAAKNSYSIRVRTTDAGGFWTEQAFTIGVVRSVDVRQVARSGGQVSTVANFGSYALVCQGRDLLVYDVSSPGALVPVGQVELPAIANDVTVSGNYAYVADDNSGLVVVDISSPASPVRVGQYDTPGSADGVSVVGSYAYVADGSSGLQIINTSNPAAPVRSGGWSGLATGVSVVGDYAYLSSGSSGLQVIKISNPAAPAKVGGYNTAGYSYGVSVAGSYAYIADASNGLEVINISNPASPTRSGGFDTGCAFNVSVVGNYAYVADAYNGLLVVNVSNPAAPSGAVWCDTPGSADDVSVAGDYAYVADTSGLQVIRVSNPAAPVRVTGYEVISYASALSVAGDYAYVGAGSGGVQVLNISDPRVPTRVGGYDTAGFPQGMLVSGGYLYVADGGSGLQVYSLSNPASPVRVGGYDTSGNAHAVSVAGHYAYVADGESGLQVLDIANPAAPVRVGGYSAGAYAQGVSVSGHYVYLADNDGLQVIDVSNPATPVRVGGYSAWNADAQDVSVVGNYAYVVDYYIGLQVFDISNPASPVLVGVSETGDQAERLSIEGNRAVVAVGARGVQVIDISNPTAPLRVGSYDTAGEASGVSLVGRYVYGADTDNGLVVLRLNMEPTDIALSGTAVAENRPAGTVVGTFSTSDPDAGETFTYSLVSGAGSADNGSFAIVGNELRTAAVFDYEAKNSYSIRVRVTDSGGLWSEKVLSVGVSDVGDEVAPAVSSVVINAGAGQRSMVKQVGVNFSEPVSLAAGALSIRLASGAAIPATLSISSADQQGYLLTFSGSGISGGSLADGVYDLIVSASGVQDLAGNALVGDYTQRFHRLFGDVDGNRVVNALDYAKMKATYGRSATDALFNGAVDYEGNSIINALDLAQFRKRYGMSFAY